MVTVKSEERVQSDDGAPGGKARDIRLAGYFLGWALSFVGATYLIEHGLLPNRPVALLVAVLPSVAAVFVLAAYTRYLREADELERLIQLQAMGWGLGGGFFAICGYLLFEPLGAPALATATLASLMPVLFAIGILAGRWRYR
jgi:drug/metabolite transporter (DMT)-like permease